MKINEDNIVKVAKALSDKTRFKILKEITNKKGFTCGDCEEIAELSQPTVSHHLKILFDANLLNSEKDGRFVLISINKKTLSDFCDTISELTSND
ncbi:MAG: ArsR/SmtB family transcription factor [Ignavibacteria bacterium]|jgi:ArsR family transcriptional regulator